MKAPPEQPIIITETTSTPLISRRHFVKRTGVATAGTVFALNFLRSDATAEGISYDSSGYTIMLMQFEQKPSSGDTYTDSVGISVTPKKDLVLEVSGDENYWNLAHDNYKGS